MAAMHAGYVVITFAYRSEVHAQYQGEKCERINLRLFGLVSTRAIASLTFFNLNLIEVELRLTLSYSAPVYRPHKS